MTEVKRDLDIRQVPRSALHEIKWNGGGEIPDVLKGTYTTTQLARQAIHKFQSEVSRRVANGTRRRTKTS